LTSKDKEKDCLVCEESIVSDSEDLFIVRHCDIWRGSVKNRLQMALYRIFSV
jgi:hypothetical protein